jgi:hypothetical protein
MAPCFNAKENLNLQQGCTVKVEDTKPLMSSLAYFKLSNSSNLNDAMDILQRSWKLCFILFKI